MTPSFHPSLVNGRFGDPALFVEARFRREALLFDLGELSSLSPRDLLRVSHAFVSHMHVDHFIGFDALLRVNVGRERTIALVGPAGIVERTGHKLAGYSWDLVHRYAADLVFEVTEVGADGTAARARFRLKTGFEREELPPASLPHGVVAAEPDFLVEAAVLEHHGPCLGYALREPAHANVWRNRLEERGLPTGAWLQELKRAVLERADDDRPIALPHGGVAPLGSLRELVTVGRGQKIAYVTDVADTPANRAAIVRLAEGADLLFIEASFAAADRSHAVARAHLTTTAAGEIAREAGVRRVEPFHFSPRYAGEEERMLGEVMAAFRAEGSGGPPASEPAGAAA